MDKVLEAAKELRNALDNTPEFQEYYRLKEAIENDSELMRMRKEINFLASQNKVEECNNLTHIYNSHPIVQNYNQIKEEISQTLLMIKSQLSD